MLTEAFASGLSNAYWPVLLSTVAGLFVIYAIDEKNSTRSMRDTRTDKRRSTF